MDSTTAAAAAMTLGGEEDLGRGLLLLPTEWRHWVSSVLSSRRMKLTRKEGNVTGRHVPVLDILLRFTAA